MTAVSNWIYHLFSSKATLGEISFVALMAAVVTYGLDLSKKREERNAVLFNIRTKAYGKIISDTADKVADFDNRFKLLFEQYHHVKSGGIFSKIDEVAVDIQFITNPLNSITFSSTISGLLQSVELMLAGGTITLNNLSRLNDPEFMRIWLRDKESLSASQKAVAFAFIGEDVLMPPEEEMDYLIKSMEIYQELIKESMELIRTQHTKELSRLSPKDTLTHRLQDKKQLKKNHSILKQHTKKSIDLKGLLPKSESN
jgi:hypothetical protein